MSTENLHADLRSLFHEMIPLCSDMIGIAKGIAGLGALFYVAFRIWQSLAKAEPIDVFPLLRPFAIGVCILFFPTLVLGTIDSVMSPVVQGTHKILTRQDVQLSQLKEKRDQLEQEAKRKNPATAYLVDQKVFEEKLEKLGMFDAGAKIAMRTEKVLYDFKKWLQQAMRDILELLMHAAALIIDVIRTFFLIVLAILGPIAFGFAVWDGFQGSIIAWLVRYLNVYLWLPVADIFSAIITRIEAIIIKNEITEIQRIGFDSGSNAIHIIFMLIAIVGYFSVPTVAGFILQASGGGALMKGVNSMSLKGGAKAAGVAGAVGGFVAGSMIKGGQKMMGAGKNQDAGGKTQESGSGGKYGSNPKTPK